jgi:hypothetical protein
MNGVKFQYILCNLSALFALVKQKALPVYILTFRFFFSAEKKIKKNPSVD